MPNDKDKGNKIQLIASATINSTELGKSINKQKQLIKQIHCNDVHIIPHSLTKF